MKSFSAKLTTFCIAVGYGIIFLVPACENQEIPKVNLSGVTGGMIGLRTACNRYIQDYGISPNELLDVEEYFIDRKAFQDTCFFFNEDERKRVEFLYTKNSATTFVVHTPWIDDGSKMFRFVTTENMKSIVMEIRK